MIFNSKLKVNYSIADTLWTAHLLSWCVFISSYLNGNIAVGASYDPRDSQRDVIMDGIGAIGARVLTVVHFGEGGPDKLQRLLQSVGVLRASVQYMSSQSDPRQDVLILVDFI